MAQEGADRQNGSFLRYFGSVKKNMKIYKVGGAVRDLLLGRTPADTDYVVLGGSEQELLRRVGRLTKVGHTLTVYVRNGEQYSLSPFESIEEDLASRDLTVNALAMDEDGHLIAHPLAQDDIRDKVLRPVACDNFVADPLRVFRAARFAACWPDFSVHPTLVAAMRTVGSERLAAITAERVGQELLKACAGKNSGTFLRTLWQAGCLTPWFLLQDVSVGNAEVEDCARIMDRNAGDGLTAWMLLCRQLVLWHCGKVGGRQQDIWAEQAGQRLRLPGLFVKAGRMAVRWLDQAARYAAMNTPARVGMVLELEKAGLRDSLIRGVSGCFGVDISGQILRESAALKSVRLPEEFRDQGRKSSEILLQLRCQVLEKTATPSASGPNRSEPVSGCGIA